MSRVYLDSNLFIYLLEDAGPRGERAAHIFSRLSDRGDLLLMSTLTVGEVLVKPIRISEIKELIRTRLANPRVIKRVRRESVAAILDREHEVTIQNWLDLVEQSDELICIHLNRDERTGHLPALLRDLSHRLREDEDLTGQVSIAAREHGEMRLQQGYTAAMVVEESRILQVSIFGTLQRNLATVDFARVLLDVVTIADEVDSQLRQAMYSYATPKIGAKSHFHGLAG